MSAHNVKRYQVYSLILITFFIQVLLSNFLGSNPFKPNLLIIVTAFFALFMDKKLGLEAGLLSGLLLDIFSIRFFGLNIVLFALGGYVVGKYNNKFYKESIITHIILTFAISLFILTSYFLFADLRSPSTQRLGFNFIFDGTIVVSSLINSLLGVYVYAFLTRVFQLKESI